MKKNGRITPALKRNSSRNAITRRRASTVKRKPITLGRYIIADPKICHGTPTFRGTRIMVYQVLEQVALGMDWISISERWGGSLSKEAIAEAVRLSSKAFLEHAPKYNAELIPA
jgi:uncharacterized protein (DUF433 family)